MTTPPPISSPVVVTGGGSGIGRATAAALVRGGRPVAVWDRDPAAAERVAEEASALGGTAVAVTADVVDATEVAQALAATREALGPVGGLVHAAGFSPRARLGEIDLDLWGTVIDVNVTAFTRILQALVDDLAARPGSAVVAVSSIAGRYGLDTRPEYSAAKHAVLGLVKSFAATLGPRGVRVNAVAPGKVRTPMTTVDRDPADLDRAAARTPLRRVGEPEDVAGPIAFLMGEGAAWITGTCLVIDGGTTATVS